MKRYELVRPFNFFEDFNRDFDRLFANDGEKVKQWKPQSRIFEEENKYHLSLDIPGVDKEHLRVELKSNVLEVEGEKRDHFKKDGEEFKSYGHFSQKFSLPEDSNIDEIEVHQHNGVLDIIIPKVIAKDFSKSLEIKSRT